MCVKRDSLKMFTILHKRKRVITLTNSRLFFDRSDEQGLNVFVQSLAVTFEYHR